MEKIKETALEILDISEKIYKINESTNSNAIFKNKVFLIGTENNRDAVTVRFDDEKKDSSYYFETPKIDGVIIKKENGNYCVKVSVKYTNYNHKELWFAKIRIELSSDKEIIIAGDWGGTWESPDYEDEDQIKNPNSDFPLALESMKNNLSEIYNQLNANNLKSAELDPELVKQLKKYNN